MKNMFNFILIMIFFFGISLNVVKGEDPESIYIWKHSSGPLHSKPVIRDSIAYYGSTDGNFYAVNTKNGTKIWQYKADRNNSFPAIKDSMVFFEASNKLYALNALTGKLYWTFTNNPVGDERHDVTDYHRSSPVIMDSLVIFCDQSGIINGVDMRTGSIIYQFQTDGHNPLRGTPAIKDSLIFCGDYKGNIYAVSLKDSVPVWKHVMQNVRDYYGAVVSEMVIKDNILYFGSQHDVFSPLDITTGQPVWTYIDPRATYLPPTPVFYEDKIIIGTTINANQIMCFKNDVNHEKLWSFQASGIFFTTPVIKDSIVIMNSCNFDEASSILYMVNCKNGALIRQMEFNNAGPYLPVIKDSILYLGTNNGLYAANINSILAGKGSNIAVSPGNQEVSYKKNIGKRNISVAVSNTGNVCDTITIELLVAEDLVKKGFFIQSKKMLSKLSSSPSLYVYTDSLPAGVYHLTLNIHSQLQPDVTLTKNIIVTITGSTDIDEKQAEQAVYIYPNPANEVIYLKLNNIQSSKIDLKIYSISGDLVLSQTLNSTGNNCDFTCNLAESRGKKISKGEYICQINTEKEVICKKLVIN